MGRGYSKSRSISGRLPNKLKRGIRALSTIPGTDPKRTRSDVARTAQKARLPSAKPVGGMALGDGSSAPVIDDGGIAVHRSMLTEKVRARSAMLRQRVLRSSSAPSKHGRQWAPDLTNIAGEDDDFDDVASEPDDERVVKADVLVKYKTCGKITDAVMARLVAEAKPGVSLFALCEMGDGLVMDMTANTFTKARDPETKEPLKRGVAFPTNVSVNNMLCHYRPVTEDSSNNQILRVGDVVKIHLGAHIDGYSTQATRTVVVVEDFSNNNNQTNQDNDDVADDAKAVPSVDKTMDEHSANTIAAAHYALTALIRAMRPGAMGSEITDLIRSFGGGFGVESCEGVLSNRTKRWILDGSQCIIQRRVVREEPQQDVAETEIEPWQVWTLDVAFTSGSTFKLIADEVTIYRRNEVPTPSELRIRAAESLLHEVRTTYLCFPFTPTQSDLGANTARLGVSHLHHVGLVDPVAPLRGKHGVITSRATCTIAVTDKRVHILSGNPVLDATAARSCIELPPQLVDPVQSVPLTFAKKKADGWGSDEDADAADTDAAAAVGGDDDGVSKNKKYVEAAMARVPRGGHSAQQLSALMPPSRNSKGDADKKDAVSGRRAMKQHRVEDD